MRRETRRVLVTFGVRGNQIAGTGNGDPQPPNEAAAAALAQAKFEADTAKANAARAQRDLDEIKKQLPTDEQKAKWAELEAAAAKTEEERALKAGEFEALRAQMNDRHSKELQTERSARENEAARAAQLEREVCEILIGREFADASDLFGPAGKTVLLPAIAQSHFSKHVVVETVAGIGGGPSTRRVVVKDRHGSTIIDSKTGEPMPFVKAMTELIDTHPQKEHLLRGSGKVGAGSPGGFGDATGDIDLSKTKPSDFKDPKFQEAVRAKFNNAGGLKVGEAFDRIASRKR